MRLAIVGLVLLAALIAGPVEPASATGVECAGFAVEVIVQPPNPPVVNVTPPTCTVTP